LLESPFVDMNDTRQCLDDVIIGGGSRDPLEIDCDSIAAAWMCKHLTDLCALHQLRRHPGRVYSSHESPLHVVGITPTLSYYTSQLLKIEKKGGYAARAASVRGRRHAQRLAEVARLIRKEIGRLPLNSNRMYHCARGLALDVIGATVRVSQEHGFAVQSRAAACCRRGPSVLLWGQAWLKHPPNRHHALRGIARARAPGPPAANANRTGHIARARDRRAEGPRAAQLDNFLCWRNGK
jgi:hypothetical protein